MSRVEAIQSGRADDAGARLARAAATCAEPLYRVGLSLHQSLYRLPIKRTTRLPRPVISVGNLTTGGTGKTPMVAWVGRTIAQAGRRPAVLTRGYAAARGDGRSDEARELAANLGEEVPILAHPDRARAAARLLEREPGVDAFVLDDGFQHYRLARDLDLVLIDATRPWGHGRLLPRGMLREQPGALRRADAVIVTRCDLVEAAALEALEAEIERRHGRPPAARVGAVWAAVREGERTHGVDWLASRRVAGACGLGNPGAFEAMLRRHAGEVVRFDALPDHHAPSGEEIAGLLEAARSGGATAMVVTEKDYVKWVERMPAEPGLPVARPALAVRFHRGEAALRARIVGLFTEGGAGDGA